MSGKTSERNLKAAPNIKKTDRRVLRTRDRLGDALIELIQQKPFKSITVQQVLDRAGVGRSTFYEHYRDKNDLFLSDIEEFLNRVATSLSRKKEVSERILPVREFCMHLASAKSIQAAFHASGHWQDLWELAQEAFSRGIEHRLRELRRGRVLLGNNPGAVAHSYAGALLGLLKFWLSRGMKESPDELDRIFHRIIWRNAELPRSIRVLP